MKKEQEDKFSPEMAAPPIKGQTRFSQQRFWHTAEDMKENEKNQLLKDIKSSLKTIEKSLERIESMFKYKIFDIEQDK
ncbi:MAG: hypothetical protein ACOX2E_00685 [Syntrophaceticus sp.]